MHRVIRSIHVGAASLDSACSGSPLTYFLLVFLLSVPFALLGAMSERQLFPGIPLSALGFVCPVAAASLLLYRAKGVAAVTTLLKRAFDFRRIGEKRRFVPVLLLMPAVAVAAYALMLSTQRAVAAPRFGVLSTTALFLAFFIAALGEELGWSGYALGPMQARWGALRASLLLGVVWAAWHVVAMAQAGQSAAWIAWGCVDMVATRVLMVWLYDDTGGSVFAVALYHTVANVSTKTLFPGGSYHAERIIAVTLVVAAAIVAAGWTPRTQRDDLSSNVPRQCPFASASTASAASAARSSAPPRSRMGDSARPTSSSWPSTT